MKYIFYVQSHIAFYMALQIQEYLKLKPTDVRYITVRNYKNYFHSINPLDFSYYYDKLNSPMSLSEAIEALDNIDKNINNLTENENYEFITHSIAPPVWQFIATNTNCKKIHLIEDGSSSYHKRLDFYNPVNNSLKTALYQNFKKLISSNYRTYCKRAPGFPIFSTEPLFKDTIYYGIYDDVFPYIPDKRKIIFGQLYKDPLFKSSINYDNASFLIFDATIVEQRKLMDYEEYMNFIIPFLKDIASVNSTIYFKFHPGQKPEIIKKLRKILQNNFHSIEIEPHIPIEQIIIHFRNLKFYGFYSTLLFYAKRHGHSTKSFIEKTEHPKLKKFALDNFNDYFIKEIFKLY